MHATLDIDTVGTDVSAPTEQPRNPAERFAAAIERTPNGLRHRISNERAYAAPRLPAGVTIDLTSTTLPDQLLSITVTQAIAILGPCSRMDLQLLPLFAKVNPFVIERAMLNAAHHGLLKRTGSMPQRYNSRTENDDPELTCPGIYQLDPLGPIDRSCTNATVKRALASRGPLEAIWSRFPAQSTTAVSKAK
ncbi:MAG: hypothetical protein Q8S02_09555 [Hydrogenophaga sp.]|nr:hypothetical protein [Hydrogenophaga sp.]